MTSIGINLSSSSSRAAKQRARNTGPLGLLGEATGGRWPSGGGRADVIDLIAVSSGCSHSVIPARLKQSAVEKVPIPENWPFDSMLTWTTAQAMKRMTDKSATNSVRKKACTV